MVNIAAGEYFENQSAYSIGIYADMNGYSILLIETTNKFVALGRGVVRGNVKTEVFNYRAIAGITGSRDQVSFKEICLGLEVMIGNCASRPTIYCNKLEILETLLIKQELDASLKFVEIDIESMVMVVNCLVNDNLLRFDNTGEFNLFVQYSKAIGNYRDIKQVDHRIFALGLALSDFIPGNADWIQGLKDVQLEMI